MGGNGGKKARSSATPEYVTRTGAPLSLRVESRGKNKNHVNAKSELKLDHVISLAVWTAEAPIPPLAAFFGERLAATAEVIHSRIEPSLFVCERCETILQPGNNCTKRLETSKRKKKITKNIVVFKCHFCCHRNTIRGTPKDYLKVICPPKSESMSFIPKPTKDANSVETRNTVTDVDRVEGIVAMPNLGTTDAATPPLKTLSLLDSKMKKRTRSRAKKVGAIESKSSGDVNFASSSKRRKKSWITLKEISEHDVVDNKFVTPIPFLI